MKTRLEVVAHLIEECSEVQHALAKLIRHGERPCWEGIQYDNVADAHREIRDVEKRIAEFREAFPEGA